MYNKRENDQGVNDYGLADHMKHFKRAPLSFNPELVSESINMPVSLFNLFLHENYNAHYSQLPNVVSVASFLSDADLFLGTWDSYHKLDIYSTSVAMRGVLRNDS